MFDVMGGRRVEQDEATACTADEKAHESSG
jgi:hypothetical protein